MGPGLDDRGRHYDDDDDDGGGGGVDEYRVERGEEDPRGSAQGCGRSGCD